MNAFADGIASLLDLQVLLGLLLGLALGFLVGAFPGITATMAVALAAGFVAMGLVNAVAFATGRLIPTDHVRGASPLPATLAPAAGIRR